MSIQFLIYLFFMTYDYNYILYYDYNLFSDQKAVHNVEKKLHKVKYIDSILHFQVMK